MDREIDSNVLQDNSLYPDIVEPVCKELFGGTAKTVLAKRAASRFFNLFFNAFHYITISSASPFMHMYKTGFF